jgi:Bardet-Biedl syndrome 9 protein
MSLFKTRDWWSTTCGEGEVFDHGCLKLSNINDNPEKKDLIIVGSYNGLLRVYNPSVVKDKNGNINNAFKAHDLIIEKSFPAPILQVETGRFVR